MKRTFPVALIVIAVTAGVIAGKLWRTSVPPSIENISEHAQILRPPRTIEPFQLVDHLGRDFTQDRLRDKWSLVFFGYTYCPDVCPTTLQALAQMDRLLAQRDPNLEKKIQVVFISVDPERDTVEQLGKYVPYFNKSFIGVTGKPDQISRLTRQLGIAYLKVEKKDDKNYLVDHSASILLFGPDGKMHGIFSAPHNAEQLTTDLARMTAKP